MQQIIHNKYDTSILSRVHNNKIKQEQGGKKKKKMGQIYIYWKRNKAHHKTFQKSNIKVAYTTNNNLGKLLDMQKTKKLNKYDKNGVYQLEYPMCPKKYIGQTG